MRPKTCSTRAGEAIGSKKPLHPNDDCNMGQSSNDVVPTTLHVAVAIELKNDLLPGLTVLAESLEAKAKAYADIVKIGRTHLMDATPVTMGQVFGGYAAQVRKGIARIEAALSAVMELAQGGTAVGTGINTHPEFGARVAAALADKTGLPFVEAANHFEAQAARDDSVEVAGQLATVAASLGKIAHDIRMLGSGPRSGLSELALKATQPGSSIMPGKVNPVMSEMLAQVTLYVTGQCHAVQAAGREGHFELNVTIPLIAKCLLDSIAIMANGARVFAKECVDGLEVNEERCKELVDRSLMLVTALNPFIGYDNAAAVAKQAFAENKTLREVVLEKGLMDAKTLDKALDPTDMVKPKA